MVIIIKLLQLNSSEALRLYRQIKDALTSLPDVTVLPESELVQEITQRIKS